MTACQKNELFKKVKDTCYYRYRLKSLCVRGDTVLATPHVEFILLHNKQANDELTASGGVIMKDTNQDYLTSCGFALRFDLQTGATTSPGVSHICLKLNLFATPKVTVSSCGRRYCVRRRRRGVFCR